jgi:hypothetical protein
MHECFFFVSSIVSKVHLDGMVHLRAENAEGKRASLAGNV